MALRAGYKGIKKLAKGLKFLNPGILSVDNDALGDTFIKKEIDLATIKTGTGVTASTSIMKQGLVVDLYINASVIPDSTENQVVIGTAPFKPLDDYVFLPIYSTASPFRIIGSCFIRKTNGEIVIGAGGIGSATAGFIHGTYIGQEATTAKSMNNNESEEITEEPVKVTTKKSTKKSTAKAETTKEV